MASSEDRERPEPAGPTWAIVVPNVLTGFRLGLAATFPLLPAPWRLPIVVLAGASDAVDGYVARRFRGTSWLGGLLDATADKAFVLIVLVTALAEGRLSALELAAVLPRDVAVAASALVAALARRWSLFREVPARPLGKATTAALFALFLLLVLEPHVPAAGGLVRPVHALAAVLSVLAAADYLRRALTLWRGGTSGG